MLSSELEKLGFTLQPNILNAKTCNQLLADISQRLNEFILLHQTSVDRYLKVVNRWPLMSLIDQGMHDGLVDQIKANIQNIIGEKVEAFEVDVLYKSLLVPSSTPCHQDVAYVWQNPYIYSVWIPLTEVDNKTSTLIFLPSSHHGPIEEAIDFWTPNYSDRLIKSEDWACRAVKPKINQGDGLVFSSKIWHASTQHDSSNERISIVIRWGNKRSLSLNVKPPKVTDFGMWSCAEITQSILQTAWKQLNKNEVRDISELISLWVGYLQNNNMPPHLAINANEASRALEDLNLLNMACKLYRGGDNQGIVYRHLWKTLLLPLKNYLSL